MTMSTKRTTNDRPGADAYISEYVREEISFTFPPFWPGFAPITRSLLVRSDDTEDTGCDKQNPYLLVDLWEIFL
jgi:hypothetical protein